MIICNEQTHSATKKFLTEKLDLVKQGIFADSGRDNLPATMTIEDDAVYASEENVPLLTGIWRKVFRGRKSRKKQFDKDTIVDAEVFEHSFHCISL